MIKPFKIKVEKPEHSEEIQEFVFKHGYTWARGGNQVTNTIYPFMYFEEEVGLFVGNCKYHFDEDELPEKWFYDGKFHDSPEVTNTKALKTQEGGTHYKDMVIQPV